MPKAMARSAVGWWARCTVAPGGASGSRAQATM